MTQAVHEVPLPPPEKPERERERRPDYEQVTIAVGAASIWVADVQRSARDFANRYDGAVGLTIELDDGRRVQARDLRAGPGEGFVTLRVAEGGLDRELGVRLDRTAGVELAPARNGEASFCVRKSGFGFDARDRGE